MIEFVLANVSLYYVTLDRNCVWLADLPPGTVIPRDGLDVVADNLDKALAAFANLGVPKSLAMGERVGRRLRSADIAWNAQGVHEAISQFLTSFLHESMDHKWARIDARHAKFLASAAPFGEAVHAKFPEASYDIICSGVAIAADLNTAAVFHLMRVAEHGLKWLAKRLHVSLRDNKKPLPINEATWGKLIEGISGRIKAERQKVKGPRTRAALERFATAATHCDYMKDIWRNNVSHAHRTYNGTDAEAAMQRVREFMQFLATMP